MGLLRQTGWTFVRKNCMLAALLAFSLPVFSQAATQQEQRAMILAADMGAYSAAMQSDGLDLRDAQNRPISRAALQSGLRAGTQAARKEAESLSAVQGLAALLDYLDRDDLAADQLSSEFPGRRHGQAAFALAAPRAPRAPAVRFSAIGAAPTISQNWHLHDSMFQSTPGRVRVLQLRL
jgi:hypothetical protein